MYDRSETELRRRILFYVSLITAIFGSVWSILYLIFQEYYGAIAVFSYSFLTFINFVLFRKIWDKPKLLSLLQIILILVMPGTVQLLVGGFTAASGVIFATVLAPLGALIFYPYKIARKILVLFCSIVFIAGLIEYFVINDNSNLEDVFSLTFFVFNFNIIAVITYFILEYFVVQKIAYQKLIELKNKDLQDSLVYARRIQNTILSSQQLIQETFPNSSLLYLPKEKISGDFSWIYEDDKNVFFTVADCTGHGVPGALVSIIGLQAINQATKHDKRINPSEILNAVNNIFVEHFGRQKVKVQDGMDIAFCKYSKETQIISYAGAMSSFYIQRKLEVALPETDENIYIYQENNSNLLEFKPDRKPIGLEAENYCFNNIEFPTQKGDRIILCTDGFEDQFGGKYGKKFKRSNFRSLLDICFTLNPIDARIHLTKTLENWQGELEQTDDICVLIIDL